MYVNGFLPVVCALALPISVTTSHHAAARFWPTLPLLTGSNGSKAVSRERPLLAESSHSSTTAFATENHLETRNTHPVDLENSHYESDGLRDKRYPYPAIA
ncbi:hypothetical protein ACP3TY_13635 [Pseudomonas rustica]|uniref:hypothetical protein n=1 Tax=Pseudomonas rustica TaxID=2827099 RepID=UPI003CE78E5A